VKAEWKYINEFPIQARMKEVVKLTIDATHQQRNKYLKQLRKLKYGS
jgi:hypothetical protein